MSLALQPLAPLEVVIESIRPDPDAASMLWALTRVLEGTGRRWRLHVTEPPRIGERLDDWLQQPGVQWRRWPAGWPVPRGWAACPGAADCGVVIRVGPRLQAAPWRLPALVASWCSGADLVLLGDPDDDVDAIDDGHDSLIDRRVLDEARAAGVPDDRVSRWLARRGGAVTRLPAARAGPGPALTLRWPLDPRPAR